MKITEYLEAIERKLATGMAIEHAYRPLLENFIKARLTDSFEVINDGKRISCGMPDLAVYKKLGKNFIDIGYIEAKDINVNLDKEEKSDQLKRYNESLENLIFTDYLEFRFFVRGEKVETIRLAKYENGVLSQLPENFEKFETLLDNFLQYTGQTIKSSKKLAGMMAKKARLMRDVFFKAINSEDSEYYTLKEQYEAFKRILIHDLTYEQFADVYAQTITYGLFTARIHDQTPDDFSRQEARELIPRSNPFLRRLFDYISGADLDHRVTWIVDSLCDLFRLVHKDEILKEFSFKEGSQDPIIHFYETFLAEYDPKLRKSRGVWYTPEPVVNFIIRAIDDCLKKYFNLPDGIASTEKVKIKVDEVQTTDKRTKSGKAQKEIEVHKVQLLDVATGTGTFIAEAIKQIHKSKFENQQAMWSNYVDEHLLPRLHGFEILMASYAMCHLKIDLLLEELGYKSKNTNNPQRLGVYLTNSLEEAHPDSETLFASWLSNEAKEADFVKKDVPVMVAFGNPPYSVSSSNNSPFIQDLMEDYKRDLNERNINPLSDDYIKFIRYAEHYIEKTGSGIVAMITNNSFIDGVIHRQMRKHLLETFDSIYIYDLHGSAKKQETTPDGKPDKNVFDIQQGVSISIFVKKEGKQQSKLADVFHYDSYGSRDEKYEDLQDGSIEKTPFKKLEYKEPYNFFVPKDFESEEDYQRGFHLKEIFNIGAAGIKTERDSLSIHYKTDTLIDITQELKSTESKVFRDKYSLKKDGRDWKLEEAKKDLLNNKPVLTKVQYRPFDYRSTLYTGKTKGFHAYPRKQVNFHIADKKNYGIISSRTVYGNYSWRDVFVTKNIVEFGIMATRVGNTAPCFPLYLYPDSNDLEKGRKPNLDDKIVQEISDKIGLPFVPDHELPQADGKTAFSPLDLLDYIYAVLHSPSYRAKYKEFLKIDFPRVPYPENSSIFWKMVALGKKIREIHLLESPKVNQFITNWNIEGDNIVEKPEYKDGNVYINKEQYFGNVPEVAWNFYIGGYQPAQKWLKDRKGRELNYDDIAHYQKIIVALTETDKLMKQIDEVFEV